VSDDRLGGALRPADPLVTIVVPVFDEADCIPELVRRTHRTLEGQRLRYELLFVDDGSRDDTPQVLAALRSDDPSISLIRFTRNFGHQAALVAGLRHARGDAVISLDGDLQHPPELLPTLLEAWRGGADVVHTRRRLERGASPGAKERAGRVFYRALNALSRVPVAPAGADFRLLDRRVVDAFNRLEEHFVFVRGLVPWLGFSETTVDYQVAERFAGRSKYRLSPMLRLALDGIFAFSVVPLRVITLLGLFTTIAGVAYGIFSLASFFAGRVEEAGWTSLVVLVLVFGGVQLLSIGIVSEYVGRTYEEVKRRPRYVIDYVRGLDRP
jgi:glycosyltransferase involved in cell wall biosynthesis